MDLSIYYILKRKNILTTTIENTLHQKIRLFLEVRSDVEAVISDLTSKKYATTRVHEFNNCLHPIHFSNEN